MKSTTAGLPAKAAELTTWPLTVSGKENSGISVPRGSIREGVRAIPAGLRRPRQASTASLNFAGQHREAIEIFALIQEGIGCAARQHALHVAARFHERNQLDPQVEIGVRALTEPALGVPWARVVRRDREQG